MRRIAQLAIATAAAAVVFATTLTPSHSRGAAALDFWSWDSFARGEGGGDQATVTTSGHGTTRQQHQSSTQSGNGPDRENGSRGDAPAR